MKLKSIFRAVALLIVGAVGGGVVGVVATYQLTAPADPPVPAAASEALQAAIRTSTKLPVAAMRLARPGSTRAWELVIEQRAASTPSLVETEESTSTRIEKAVLGGVPVYWITPDDMDDERRVFIYVHGGAYVFGGGDAAVREAATIASVSGLKTISIDYRMPPSDPYPAAVEDVAAVYRALLETWPADHLAIGGTSAGGGLSMAALHYFKQEGLPMPAALYLGTPWADLTKTSDTLYTLEGIDRNLSTYDGLIAAAAELYADGVPLTDPLISPVYGDFGGFPPTYLVTGTRDLLLSDTARVHRKLRLADVVAELNVYEGVSHADYAFVTDSPEYQQTYRELSDFLQQHLGP